MIRFVQIACIAVTALILYGIWTAFLSLRSHFSVEFPIGFLSGLAFAIALYGIICWLDPASRPRGTGSKQD